MPERVTHEELMRFIDGELAPHEEARIAEAVGASTELQREIALFRAIRNDFLDLSFQFDNRHRSVWDDIDRRLTRPVGWILVIAGTVVWLAYGVFIFVVTPGNPWEKLASAAVVIGFVILLASVLVERYREWLHDPYRDVYR
jgi:anti-sigma factor RsiW